MYFGTVQCTDEKNTKILFFEWSFPLRKNKVVPLLNVRHVSLSRAPEVIKDQQQSQEDPDLLDPQDLS
jgi:hypothetical protein